jgi:FkbM family methyltransferase
LKDATNKVHSFVINGFPIEVVDMANSIAPEIIARELRDDCYGLNRIDFAPGDVVIDIGAHIGMFAIYTALRFPQLVIHAFEPFPENFELLEQNLDRNGITTVRIHRQGVTGDGRLLEMVTNPQNSGGSTCYSHTLDHGRSTGIPSTTLDHIFDSLGIDKCKLLKIDCEGSEYEILFSTHSLSRVEYLSGEFHHNQLLERRGYTVQGLLKHCESQIPRDKLLIKATNMSE